MFRLITVLACLISGQVMAQCGSCQFETDLVVNGNFNQGNVGFSSDLNYVTGIFNCPLCPENTYTIGANAIFYHSDFLGSDHTNPPLGNFFIANGPGQSGSLVWCQTINVQPNTDYVFTFWAQDVTNNTNPHPTALLQASLNGVLSPDTLNADGQWEALVMNWNSGPESVLELCIVNQQSQTGGNDFGLDDISLVGCHDYQLSQLPFAGDDVTVCSDQSITLGNPSQPGYSYSWNNTVGITSASVANPIFSMSNVSGSPFTNEYILTTDSAGVGCILSDTVYVTVLYAPAFDLGSDITLCPQETTTLDAGSAWTSVLWNTQSTDQIIACGPGQYSAIVNYGSCAYEDSILVVEQTMPLIELGDTLDICETNPVQLDAGIAGLWNTGETAASIVVDQSGLYSFTYVSGNCSTMDEVLVNVYTMPLPILPADTSLCEGASIVLDAGISGEWNSGVTSNSIVVSVPGYSEIQVQNGPCIAVAGTQTTMLLLPYAMLPEDTLICEGSYITIDTEADQNDSYIWSTGDTTSSITFNTAGIYEVSVMNECGVATTEIFVESYLCGWDIFVPNTFTPNGDGINDEWLTASYNVSNLKIFIYNRLGNLIFYSTNPDEPWTPSTGIGDDVYNYRIEAISFENERILRTGHIYLLR